MKRKNGFFGRSWTATAWAVLLLLGAAAAGAQEAAGGAAVNGYARTKAGAFLDSGDYFLAENTLDLRLSYDSGGAAFYGNAALYEKAGEVLPPDLRELYIDLRGDSVDLRMGKQQIIWGKGDGVFITDIVSPRDLSEFLVPDFEEIRRAVTAAKADFFSGSHSLGLVWVPWFTPTIMPDRDSPWAPSLPFPVEPEILPGERPDFSLDNASYFARYSYLGMSFDLSLVGGWTWNDTPAYEVISKTLTPGTGLTSLTLEAVYYRIGAAGFAAAGTVGPLVVKSEGALFFGKRYQGNPLVFPRGYAEKNAVHYLLGADYSFAGITLGLQFIQNIILDHDDGLVEDELENTVTVVLSRTFLRETLKAEVFTYVGLNNRDALVKPKITWSAADGLEIFAGAYIFLGEEGDFGQYDRKDGLYAGAKLSF
jgi:hypothetical protein